MMPFLTAMMFALSNSLAGSIVAKVTIIMVLGLSAAWLARGHRAAVRHALLAATFGAMLLLPVFAALMPPFHVRVPRGVEGSNPLVPLGIGVDISRSVRTASDNTVATAEAPFGPKPSPFNLLLAAWCAGAALFLLPVILGLWQVRSLRRSGLPWRQGQSVAEPLALNAGIHRRVEVLLHEAVPGPMTCGVFNPTIFLPRDAENWSLEDLSRATIHELEHIRRGDWMSLSLARTISALYWFHPLAWIAWRRLTLETERACDDAVLRCSDQTVYAEQLLALARRLLTARRSLLPGMANRADLGIRITAVLDNRQRRGQAGIFTVSAAFAAAAALVIGLSPLTLVAAPAPTPPQTVTRSKTDAPPLITVDPKAMGESLGKSDPRRLIAQSRPAQLPQTPADVAPGRLLALFFDLNSLDAETLMKARESAITFVQYQAAPGDKISVMTYASKVNVLQDFTDNHDRLLAALRTIAPADNGNKGAANGIAGTEFAIFTADRLLAAIQNTVEILGAVPEKKALLYFSGGTSKNGADNQAQLRATVDAAIQANVAIYPVDPHVPMVEPFPLRLP